MKQRLAAAIFILSAVPLWAGVDAPTVVIDRVTIASRLGDGAFVLADGRQLRFAAAGVGSALAEGDSVRVIATLDPSSASRVLSNATLLDLTKSDDEIDAEGEVTSVAGASFGFSYSAGDFTVDTDESTEFQDVAGVSDLTVGDAVRVKGQLAGDVIHASEVRLLASDGDGGGGDDGGGGGGGGDSGGGDSGGSDSGSEDGSQGVDFTSVGQIVSVTDPDTVALDDNRVYRADSSTAYTDGLTEFADLTVGMVVEIQAVRDDNEVNRALSIELTDDGSGVTETSGVIAGVDATGFDLEAGPRVQVVASTEFDGDADTLQDLQPGWSVRIRGYLSAGVVTALEVEADNPAAATTGGQEYEPHQALVVLAAGADPAAVAARYGAEILGEIGDVAVLFHWSDDIDDDLLARLNADPEVSAVEPNYLFRDPESVRRRYVVVDRQHVDSEYTAQPAVPMIHLGSAQFFAQGQGSVVAVIDTGVDPDHPALQGKILSGGLDLVDGDDQPWETRDLIDEDGDGDIDEAAGHGTFVSSLIVLVAPEAKILPYRVLDDDGGGSAYRLALALADAISRHVDVINLSLVYQRRSAAVDRLLEEAGAAGITVVAATGNDGLDTIPFPASDRHTVAVTGLSLDGSSLAAFANRGPTVTIAAPSEEIYGAIDQGRWGTWSGTSMAVPFVAGAMAVLHQVDPGLDPALFVDLVNQTGRPVTDGGWTGVGLDLGAAVGRMVPFRSISRPSPPGL